LCEKPTVLTLKQFGVEAQVIDKEADTGLLEVDWILHPVDSVVC
jgi:hypothetical protein